MSFAISCACGKVWASPKVWHRMTPAEKAALKEKIRECEGYSITPRKVDSNGQKN